MNANGPRRGMSQKVDKPLRMQYVLIRLAQYLSPYKGLLSIAIILTMGSNLLSLVGPMISGYAIDAIELGQGRVDFQQVFYYVGLMIIFYIVSSLATYLLSTLMVYISQKVIYQMRKDVFNKLVELPVSYFDRYQTGDIISKISYDIDTVNTSLSNDLVQICASIITVVGSFIMMFAISPTLILVFVVTIPISIGLTRYMMKRTRPLYRKRSASLGALNGFIEEMISGGKTLKAYDVEATILQEFDEKNKEAVDAYYKAEYFSSSMGPSVNFVNNLSLALISIFGALLYLFGKMTLGDISSFVLYSRKFSGPINEIANILSELQSACAAAERVFSLLDEDSEVKDLEEAVELSDVLGDVKLKNVQFGYTPEHIVLKNLNLEVQSGQLIAIVGPTGAGKTTLINLLMRFYDPLDGAIYIDNHEIMKLTRKSLRKAYAMVLQDTWLFHGTIFDNIAYGKEDATREEVIEAAKAAKIHSYIMHLPNGYDTILSEDGINISKGQKQLLTIARAMLLDAKMLILDEATSNVDTRTETQIQEAMRSLMKDKTCFVIAHRLSTIRGADKILVVKDGDIIEQGNHESLLEAKGFYHQLYYSQFE